jgi:hypothetical protein
MLRKEVLVVFGVALSLCILVNLWLVEARPPETEGTLRDEKQNGGLGWGILAEVEGNWAYYMNPPRYVFYEELCEGWRWADYGVWYISDLTLDSYCGSVHVINTTSSIYTYWQAEIECDIVQSQSDSWFQNILGQIWRTYSGWAIIEI